MKLRQLLHRIEDTDALSCLSLASDAKTFLRAVQNCPEISELNQVLHKRPDVAWTLVKRAFEISQRHFDTSYRFPWDVTLAAYIWLLANHDERLARNLVGSLQLLGRNLWWAKIVARSILSQNSETIVVSSSEPMVSIASTGQSQVRLFSPGRRRVLYGRSNTLSAKHTLVYP